LTDAGRDHHLLWDFIQPGKPAQNAYIDRFNRTSREDVLDAYLFDTIEAVRTAPDTWMEEYTGVRRMPLTRMG
jgi:putative transposase